MIHSYLKWVWNKGYRINPEYTFEGFTILIANKGFKVMDFISKHWHEIQIDE